MGEEQNRTWLCKGGALEFLLAELKEGKIHEAAFRAGTVLLRYQGHYTKADGSFWVSDKAFGLASRTLRQARQELRQVGFLERFWYVENPLLDEYGNEFDRTMQDPMYRLNPRWRLK